MARLRVVASPSPSNFLGHWFMRHSSLDHVADRLPWPVKSLLLIGMFTLVLMSRAPDRAFIYFQF